MNLFVDGLMKAYQVGARMHADGVLFRSGTALRRGAAISGFVGPNGGGKSYAMVATTLPSLDEGRRVLSTVRLLDWRNPRPCEDQGCRCDKDDPARHLHAHPCYRPWTSWQQLLEAGECDVLADEITGVASSREYSSLPAPIANLLVQMRRRDIVFRWTAPNWKRADVILRECTQMATVCTGFYPQVSGDESRAWIENRLLKLVSYDAALMDDFEAGKTEDLEVWAKQWIWRPKNFVQGCYDTYDQVNTIGTVSDAGRCVNCGGTRRAPACSCADYVQVSARTGSARKRSEDGPGTPELAEITQLTPRRAVL